MPERDDFTHSFGPVAHLPDRPCDPPEAFEHLDVIECPCCEAAGFPAGILLIDGQNQFCPVCNPQGRGVTLARIVTGVPACPTGWTEYAPGEKQRPTPSASTHGECPSCHRPPTHGELCLALSRARAALARIAQYARDWDRRGRPVGDMLQIGGEAEQALADIAGRDAQPTEG